MEKIKLYAYTDETGIDTAGRFFLVCVVLLEQSMADRVDKDLEGIEKKTGRDVIKWAKSSLDMRKRFIEKIVKLDSLKHCIFYSQFADDKKYLYMTAVSIARAIEKRGDGDYSVKVIVDALNDQEISKLRKYLKQLKVKYDTVRGMKDEQTAFLRLADALAGFIRDCIEDQPYTGRLFVLLKEKGIVSEV